MTPWTRLVPLTGSRAGLKGTMTDQSFRLLTRFAVAAAAAAALALVVAIVFPSPVMLPPFPVLPPWGGRPDEDPFSSFVELLISLAALAVLAWWALAEALRLRRGMIRGQHPWRLVLGIAFVLSATVGLLWGTYWFLETVLVPELGHPRGRIEGKVLFFLSFFGWVIALGAWLVFVLLRRFVREGARKQAYQRSGWVVMAVALLLPLMGPTVLVMRSNLDLLLLCIPSTAFALAGVHLFQRYRRMPFYVLLSAFGWGALISFGAAGLNAMYLSYVPRLLRSQEAINAGLNLSAGVFEEMFKGAGIAVIYLLARRWFDNVASGVVVGAAVGLGFNFTESVEYMAVDAGMQFWIRQTVGLMTSHVGFSALVGAAFGIARQLGDPRRGQRVVAAGYAAAACGHFVNNYVLYKGSAWFTLSDDPVVTVLLVYPAAILLLQGPFLVVYLLLLRHGLREQATVIAQQTSVEAWSGHGVITPPEVPLLSDARERFRERLRALRNGGPHAWRVTGRLRAAQLDLLMHRWHRSRNDRDATPEGELALRERVLQLKQQLPGAAFTGWPARAEVRA